MIVASQHYTKLPNFFGGIGYISVISQWLWTLALTLPVLLENESVKQFLIPEQTVPTESSIIAFDENSLFMIIIAAVVTIIVLMVTVVVLIRLPIALVRTSQKTVTSAVETIIPTITHHKAVSKKKQALLSSRIRAYIKLFITVVPLVPLAFITEDSIGLDSSIALLIGAVLAIGSLVWFSLQYGSAKLLKLPSEALL